MGSFIFHVDETFLIRSKEFYEDFGYYPPMGKFREIQNDYELRIERFEPLRYHKNREFREIDYFDYIDRRIPGYAPKLTRKRKFFVESYYIICITWNLCNFNCWVFVVFVCKYI